MASNKRELAFLIGAGAVKNAGLPLTTELTDLLEASLTKQHAQLLPAFRFISGAIQFGKGCRNQDPQTEINIEDFMSACTFLATRGQSYVYPFVSAWHELINALQKLPEDLKGDESKDSFKFLGQYCERALHDWLEIKDSSKLKYLRGFQDFLNSDFRLRLFTLNYDECLERSLQDILGEINKKWTTGFSDRGWSPDLLEGADFDVYLYKLHGSLDWIDDPELGICNLKWPATNGSEVIPEDYKPLLIFGTDAKMQAVDPFLTLLYRFREVLHSSEVIVVVGYSFGDSYINSMLFEALQRNPRSRCVIANRSGKDALLLRAPDFGRLVAVEERFDEVKGDAADAFNSNSLLEAVQNAFERRKEDVPF